MVGCVTPYDRYYKDGLLFIFISAKYITFRAEVSPGAFVRGSTGPSVL